MVLVISKPNIVVRVGSMNPVIFGKQKKRAFLRGRVNQLIGRRAARLFGETGVLFLRSSGINPNDRVNLVVSLDPSEEAIVFGPAFISEWLYGKWLDRIEDESRLEQGMTSGLPWK